MLRESNQLKYNPDGRIQESQDLKWRLIIYFLNLPVMYFLADYKLSIPGRMVG